MPLHSLVVSLLLSFAFTFLFSRTRGILHLNFFDTQVPSVYTEELVLPCYARTAFSRHRYNGHSLPLSSYLTRIGRIENLSCSACRHPSQGIFHLIIHCPATNSLCPLPFGNSRPFYRLWSGDALGNCLASGAP